MPGKHHHIEYVPESPHVRISIVGWSAFAALLLLVITIGGFYGIYRDVIPFRHPPAPQAFPSPRVETTENDELRRLTDAQNKKLETWQWSDDQHSLVQIPIERAMQLLAKRGAQAHEPLLPAQAALAPPTAAAEQATIQQGHAPAVQPDASTPEPHK